MNLSGLMCEEMAHVQKFERCMVLNQRLIDAAGKSAGPDALSQYRLWWDSQGIQSETEDGWPEQFCFDEENVKKFADYWKGDDE